MLVPPTDPIGLTPLIDVGDAVPLVRHALRSRTSASASTRASAGGNEAPPTRGTVGNKHNLSLSHLMNRIASIHGVIAGIIQSLSVDNICDSQKAVFAFNIYNRYKPY